MASIASTSSSGTGVLFDRPSQNFSSSSFETEDSEPNNPELLEEALIEKAPKPGILRRCRDAVSQKVHSVATSASSGVIKLVALNADSKQKEQEEVLKWLTGSTALTDALRAGSPSATQAVIYALENLAKKARDRAKLNSGKKTSDASDANSLENVTSFLSCGPENVRKIINAALLRAVANIMKATYDADRPHQPFLMRILGWLDRNMEPELAAQVSEICQSALDENKQYDAFVVLFTDTKNKIKLGSKILNLAFPKGDMGLLKITGANLALWKVLNYYMPSILASLVQNFIFIKSPSIKEGERKIEREEKQADELRHMAGVKKEHEQGVKELSTLLYDREPFIRRMRACVNLPSADLESAIKARRAQEENQEGCLALWQENGVTAKVRHLENFFEISSKSLIQQAKEYLIKDSNSEALLASLTRQYGISPIFNHWLSEQLKLLVRSEESLGRAIWTNLEDCTSKALFNMIVNMIAKVRGIVPVEEPRESGLVHHILVRLAKMLKDHGASVSFTELSKELASFAEDLQGHRHPLHALPVPPAYRDFLWNLFKTQLLPDVVFPYLKESFSQRDLKSLSEEFDGMFLGFDAKALKIDALSLSARGAVSSVTMACQTMGLFVTEFTPHYIATESETVAETLMELDLVKSGLVGLSPAEKGDLKAFIRKMLVAVGTSRDENFCHLFKEVGNYSQALTMKILGQAFRKIHLIENAQPKFLLKTVIDVLKMVGDHFQQLSVVTDRSNKKHAYEVPGDQMLMGLAENRHPGMADPNLPEEERIKIEMQGFYVPITARLLKFSGVSKAADLSLPPALFELLKTTKGPELMRKIMEKMLDKHSLNLLMIKTLEPLHSVMEDIAANDEESLLAEASQDSEEQKVLNRACGNAVQALVKMLPVNITKVFFKLKVIQDLSAEVVGRLVMKKIADTTILELVNIFCKKMFSEKIPVVAEPVSELEKVQTEKELKKIGVKLTSQKIDDITRNFFADRWALFQKWLNEIFSKLGPKGGEIKKTLDDAFDLIFFKVFGSPLIFIWENTLYRLFNLIIKAYLTAQADGVLKSMHLGAHKNAVFNIFTKILNDLEAQTSLPEVQAKYSFEQNKATSSLNIQRLPL